MYVCVCVNHCRRLLARLCLVREELRWLEMEFGFTSTDDDGSLAARFARKNVPQRCIAFLKVCAVLAALFEPDTHTHTHTQTYTHARARPQQAYVCVIVQEGKAVAMECVIVCFVRRSCCLSTITSSVWRCLNVHCTRTGRGPRLHLRRDREKGKADAHTYTHTYPHTRALHPVSMCWCTHAQRR